MSGADEFRGAPEFGVCASRRHRGHRLTAPHQRTGVGFHARTRFDRHRFAGEHGLIEQDFSRGEVHVGSNHATERKFHHIARDQFGGSMLPLASEAIVYSELSFSSLIVSALIIVPQVIVAVMGSGGDAAPDGTLSHVTMLMVQASPAGCQSKLVSPFSWLRIKLSIARVPKPERVGGLTGGPPFSVERKTSRPFGSHDHAT
jgi:hypothetical protein